MITLAKVKEAIRWPFAWPGGYEKVLIMSDGEYMHTKCAHANFRDIVSAHIDGRKGGWPACGWEVEGVDINWEDTDAYCAQCGERVISEYAG